jgi:hypothetical protein
VGVLIRISRDSDALTHSFKVFVVITVCACVHVLVHVPGVFDEVAEEARVVWTYVAKQLPFVIFHHL